LKVCRGCGDAFTVMRPMQSVCSVPCAQKVHALNKEKKASKIVKAATIKRDKASRKAVLDLNRRSIPWQHKRTKTVFNKMRVLEEFQWFEDHNLPPTCISCGKENMDWCCGHYQSVGSTGGLRYDRQNTYLQCNKYCNKELSGNISGNKTTRGYEKGLIERFGEDKAHSIMEYCKSNTGPVKWYWEDMEDQRARFAKEIKLLEAI
jgi:hypothetical protein